MQNPGIAAFLNDKDEFIVTETARAINDDLSIKEALPALGDLLTTTAFKNEALIRRAINANLRVGTEKAMQNLIAYSAKENAPAAMRAEATEALSTWSKPSVLDRVDGRYRGVVERNPQLVKNTAGEPLVKLLNDKNLPVRLSAIKAVGRHKIEAGSEKLYSLLSTDKQPEVRIEALRALASLDNAPADKAIQLALADKEKRVRVAGLDLLGKMDISKDLMVSLLSDVINTRTTEEKQAALLTLGKLPVENSRKVFDGLLTKLSDGKLPAEVHLELAEAIDSTRSSELKTRYNEVTAKLSPDAVAATYQAALYGGDADAGRRIFFNHSTAQCIRCHSYEDLGGNAGPRLNGVASRISRKQILEALINPSARLAPGFGVVTLNLTGDKTISGILQEENAKGLVLKIGDRPDTLIPKAQIVKRTNAQSSMPNMSQLLTPREVRNLVSFLATLKEEI
jgi:putative heme-binding domain-containing protein